MKKILMMVLGYDAGTGTYDAGTGTCHDAVGSK